MSDEIDGLSEFSDLKELDAWMDRQAQNGCWNDPERSGPLVELLKKELRSIGICHLVSIGIVEEVRRRAYC